MATTFNSWMGYSLCRLQEIYAVQVMGLDKDIYIPSYQVMRTTAAMAHSAVTHCQDLHLNYRHELDASWSQGSLRGASTLPLEGFHSEGRGCIAIGFFLLEGRVWVGGQSPHQRNCVKATPLVWL